MLLSVLLIPFFVFLIFFTLFFISAIFHVKRYELVNGVTITMTTLFMFGTALIGIIATREMLSIDWSARVTFNAATGPALEAEDTQTPETLQF